MIIKKDKLPNSWQCVKLAEIAEEENKYAIVDGPFGASIKQSDYLEYGIPLIRIHNISKDGSFVNGDFLYISEEKYRENLRSAIKKDDILVSRVGTIGNVCIYPGVFEKAMLSTTGVCKISINRNKADVNFVYFFMLTEDYKNQLILNSSESVQKYITLDTLKESELPLPPLAEQKRIAAIAQKADRLRRTRRYALQLSDTYLQSVFLEMFGDPVTNPKGWEMGTLDDVIISAKDGPHVSPNYSDSGIPFLSTRNVRKGELIWEDLKFISYEDAEQHWKKCKPERGDILYTKGGTTGLAKAIDFDREIAVWVHIAVLKPRRDLVIPNWLETMLNTDFCYKQSQELTFGIVNRDLGLQRMPKIKIYIPPLPLQEKFAQIAQKFERLRTQQREAERQAEHLFQTILHRAFRGELTSEDINEEPAFDILEQNPPKQTKPETTAKAGDTSTPDTAKNPDTKAKQQYTEAIQLKLPGFE